MLANNFQELVTSLPLSRVLLTVGLIIITLWIVSRKNVDPREPPEIKPTIPAVGHIINLVRNGLSYYTKISLEHRDLPIFTINIPGAKSYVITAPSLMLAVQRNSRNISFDPFLDVAASRIAGCSPATCHALLEKKRGGLGVNQLMVEAMHPALLGEGLDGMNEAMVKGLKLWLDGLLQYGQTSFDLFEWCKEAMTVASTDSVWGPLSPFKDKAVQDCFWEFEAGVGKLMPKVVPQITARKAWKGRETLVRAFIQYYKADGLKHASVLAHARYNVHVTNGIPIEEVARIEASMGLGLLSNTVPTTFWFMFDLFSRPKLLEQLRGEIKNNALHVDGHNAIIDVADLRDQCPLLVSTFQESLRFRASGASTRFVYEDMMLDNKYLLKAGSIAYIPVRPVHSHPDVWSDNSKDFVPDRYLKSKPRKLGGFLGFGVSPSICPGRHFASGEIISFAAAMIMRFDLFPAGSSPWIDPKLDLSSVVSTVTPPGEPFPVTLKAREEYKDYEWDFRVTKGKGQFALVIG
ncbi:cytochrome P450 oxidoreductase, putative [Talaromyces stipitatus ATCC 10500]|uniref:Cytochrome P450 oxidoreductase, putative n=1 Tax=Talaromyces stipitatus (strain ATCC 10500 / CBS 375.48 / QM 6759 / NRRL 1006) TaxID=441959 RepID=B8MVE0_TALSN|nr:cytochrome P450 oxidoreductase, putative [Talaromyces stipitatus ATCC 10500]EED11449.1 cytochrome P450 oxidoreductase, putative [Talaromyces stipitatus ATCC 10500]